MNKIIQEQYDFIRKLFQKNLIYINDYESKSKYPQTLKALMRFSDKIDSIKDGLDVAESKQNFYLSQILLRTLLEHLLVAYYIWTKNRLDKSDELAEKYFMEYYVSERFKQMNYNLGIEGIVLNKSKYNTFENIKRKYPEFKEMEEKQLTDIHTKAYQFEIRKIGDYLINEYPNEDDFSIIHNAMLDFLKKYNLLSSYIHGGPFADKQYYEDFDLEKKTQIVIENRGWSLIASRMIKEYIISALTDDIIELRPALKDIIEMYEK